MTVALDKALPATVQSQDDTPGFAAERDQAAGSPRLIAALGLLMFAWLPSYVSAQHVHGVIDLGVVIEDQMLAVSVDAPLSDVVGFEHAPGNEEQASRLEKAAAILANADLMFGLTGTAGCNVTSTEITAPDYLEALIAGAEDHDDHHGHDHDDHDKDHDGHGHEDPDHDHDSHGHDHDGHEHDDDHGTEHAELNAAYQWTCRNPSELDALALSFVESFVSVETVRVQLLTSDGAQVMSLTGKDTSLPLARR